MDFHFPLQPFIRDGNRRRHLVGSGNTALLLQPQKIGIIDFQKNNFAALSVGDRWRNQPDPGTRKVTPEIARLLQLWRHHRFNHIRPFFCQVEAVETAIWLLEVAPQSGNTGKYFLNHLDNANRNANPEILRLALKLATGSGKTTVMAMLIAWQTINAVRRPKSKKFSRGFLVVSPGLTIRDRLRVPQPNDPDSYHASRELIPTDMLADLERAKIVITNYHAFKLREWMDISKGGRSLLQGFRVSPSLTHRVYQTLIYC